LSVARAKWLQSSSVATFAVWSSVVGCTGFLLFSIGAREDQALLRSVDLSEPLQTLVLATGTSGAHTARLITCADEPTPGRLVWQQNGVTLHGTDFADAEESDNFGAGCVEHKAVELPDAGAFSVELERAPDSVHLTTLRVLLLESKEAGHGERLACVLLLLAMLVELFAWRSRGRAAPPRADWRAFDPMLSVLLILIGTIAVSAVVSPTGLAPLRAFGSGEPIDGTVIVHLSTSGTSLLWMMVGTVGVYWFASAFLSVQRTSSLWRGLRLCAPTTGGVLLPLLAGAALALAAGVLLTVFAPAEPSPMQWMTTVPGTLVATAAVACLSPWYEELFFRGLLFTSVESKVGGGWAAALSASLFTLSHVPQHQGYLVPLVPIALVAVATSWLRRKTHSVAPAFAFHLGYNALLIVPALLAA